MRLYCNHCFALIDFLGSKQHACKLKLKYNWPCIHLCLCQTSNPFYYPMLYNTKLVLTGNLAGHSYQKCRQEDPSAGFLTNPYGKNKTIYHACAFTALAKVKLYQPTANAKTSRTIERWGVVRLYCNHCFALIDFLGSKQHACKLQLKYKWPCIHLCLCQTSNPFYYPMLYNTKLVLTGNLAGHSYQKCRQEDPSAGFLTNPYGKNKTIYHACAFTALAKVKLYQPTANAKISRAIERWGVVRLYCNHCFALIDFLGSKQHACKLKMKYKWPCIHLCLCHTSKPFYYPIVFVINGLWLSL